MKRRPRKRTGKGGPRTYRGKKVTDGKKNVSFVATTGDCERGKPNDPGNCAAALAIKRSYPGAVAVYVHRNVTFVELPEEVIRYRTTSALRDQQIRYDAGAQFDAGVYSIGKMFKSAIAARGTRHSPPDRQRGDPNSPKRRTEPVPLRHHLGREAFHFSSENSDYRR